MFYTLSKFLWFFVQPSTFLVLLGCVGLILSLTRLKKTGRLFVALSIFGLLLAGLSPVGQMLMLPLEERFPAVSANAPEPDGIIFLGGAVDTHVSAARGNVAVNEGGERMIALLALAREYPDAKLVFTGGGGGHRSNDMNESEVTARFMEMTGLPIERVLLEDKSLNTWQNANFTKVLVDPQPGERWLLVTSAGHMPRAVGCFRRAGFDVVAYPVDYRTQGKDDAFAPFKSVSEGLRRVDAAVREWLGLVVYRLTGRSSAFFPAP